MKRIIIIFSLLGSFVLAKEDKYVQITLDSKWKQTPLLLEASEFLADKRNSDFWKFVNKVKNNNLLTDKAQYELLLKEASSILTVQEVDVLKFSLSIRSYSPRVQLHYQLSNSFNIDCDVFFQYSEDGVTCDLQEALKSLQSSTEGLLQKFDHVYPDTETNKNVLIVYADISKQSFETAHNIVLSKLSTDDIKYALRHNYKTFENTTKVRLSGFGVELAVKSTEYKNVDDQKVEDNKKGEKLAEGKGDDEVEGFLFNRLRELHPTLQDNLEKFKTHLKESNKELAPLKVWQLQDLSFQAAQRIVTASSLDALNVLKDISQNVPMVTRSLAKTKVDDNLRNEISANQKEFEKNGIAPGDALLYINGIDVSVNDLNPFKFMDVLKSETISMARLSGINLDKSKMGGLLSLNVKPEQESLIVDTRSDSVQWINDLENDDQYSFWPRQLQEILRPTFPGMLRYIAKNIFHAILYMDPLDKDCIDLYLQFHEFHENQVPVRFGVVFVSDGTPKDKAEDNTGAAIIRAFSFIKSDKDSASAFKFLTKLYVNNQAPSSDAVIKSFKQLYGETEADETLGPDSDYDDLRRVSKKVFDTIGLKALPQVLINGQQLAKDDLKRLESSLVETVLSLTPPIQQAVYMGSNYGYPSIYDYVLSQPNVVTRLNSIIQKLDGKFVNVANFDGDINDDIVLETLTEEEAVGAIVTNVKYFIQEHGATTIWVIADAKTRDGVNLIKNALKYVNKQKNARLAIFVHGDSKENQIVQTVLSLRQKLISGVAKLLVNILGTEEFTKVTENAELLASLSEGITGINKKKLVELLSDASKLDEASKVLKRASLLVRKAFGIKAGQNLVYANGRVLGPLEGDDIFVSQDFELLQNYENNRCGYKVAEAIESMNLPNLPVDGHDRFKSDIVMTVIAALSQRGKESRTELTYRDDKHSVINLQPKHDGLSYQIDAVVDPLSKGAQKLVPVLMVLYESFNVKLKIFMNCKAKHSELPVNRFYQYVLKSKILFDDAGNLRNDQTAAIFHNLPSSALLTLIMDTPQSWMIEAVGSNQDLDNIFLDNADQMVYGDFELQNIIIEGHAADVDNQSPPRGLQFVLGTKEEVDIFDTIVMANLGYFQLKAFPGSLVLQLREGRSSQIYKIDSLEGGVELVAGQNYTVIVDSFSGTFLKAQVKRQEGQEKADLLGGDADESEEDGGLWSSFASYVKREKSTKVTDKRIHIFSVATGLLYERFLRIMMLSVLKHTETPVKFWFLKNYLSSGFMKFLPFYADKHGFEYELVQYQWPKWLNGQTEKQRIIWGYKILFLDVLFPLNLERIIFVDADQIVRADLKELMDMDLGGAPYAYTPFCDDRTEVEGFRFWKQGYWRNHLSGRPYHISALYVVDLKRFRKVAAGDRLRGQYQGLSQDPNSLSNLDQDLPNNMIHQVEIFSLPQEWLWCETWCSDESKTRAKTIDMCNNPQTKEPKLDRAIRIAPEWTEYDDVIKKLQEEMTTSSKSHAKHSDTHGDQQKNHKPKIEL